MSFKRLALFKNFQILISNYLDACDEVRCSRDKICILNIQGLPMCRCPSHYQCKRMDELPVCTRGGTTYKNRCYMNLAECTSGTRAIVVHDGRCTGKNTPKEPQIQEKSMVVPLSLTSFMFTAL